MWNASSSRAMPVRRSFFFAMFAFATGAFAGCGSDETTFEQDEGDYELELAVAQARETLGEFIKTLKHPKPGQSGFAVKARFETSDGMFEAIWLTDVTFNGMEFEGTIANEPLHVAYLKKGLQQAVLKSDVVDWSYVDGDQRMGGRTDVIISRRASPVEDAAADDAASD